MVKKLFVTLMNRGKREDGAVAIIAGISITFLLLMSAFVLDLGYVYVEKSRLQNALDAAALAAAQELPDTEAARVAAAEYMEKNGYRADDIEITFTESDNVITVEGVKKIEYNIAKIVGFDYTTIKHYAKAGKDNGLNTGILPPFALFHGSTTEPMVFNNLVTVSGNVHSNKDVVFSHSAVIKGDCQAYGNLTNWYNPFPVLGRMIIKAGGTVTGSTYGKPVIYNANFIPMPDLEEYLPKNPRIIYGNVTFDNRTPSLDDEAVFVYGNVTINSQNFKIKGCLGATGNIKLNHENIDVAGFESMALYSTNGNIEITGRACKVNGVMYAPNGKIIFNNENIKLTGCAVAKEIVMLGNNTIVTYDVKGDNGGRPKLLD